MKSKIVFDIIFLVSVLKTGIVTKAKGSSYVEQGQTKVICAVYGPREIPRRSDFSMRGILNCTFERAPFASHQRRPQGPQNQDPEEDEVSMALGQALEATVCMVSKTFTMYQYHNIFYVAAFFSTSTPSRKLMCM